ncbi:hypothetical protein ACKC9G_04570 [Pokkaliibacter sp. CJK22405]|uniref:hypothetical protein n=1 Tax=Pokkaliibacter sp. CJK22405 TaxID=3384615 RepID=UPI0039850C66
MSVMTDQLDDESLLLALEEVRHHLTELTRTQEFDEKDLQGYVSTHQRLLEAMVSRESLQGQKKQQLELSQQALREWQPQVEASFKQTQVDLKRAMKGGKMLKAYRKRG